MNTTTATLPVADSEFVSALHTIEEQAIHQPILGQQSNQDSTFISIECPQGDRLDMETRSTAHLAEQLPSVSRKLLDDLFHDQNSGELISCFVGSDRSISSVFLQGNFPITDADDGGDHPFEIHRKLLRRRHVRKEQLQKQREAKMAKKIAERNEKEHRKRPRAVKTLQPEHSATWITEPSVLELSTPKLLMKTVSRTSESIHINGIRVTLMHSPHCDSPDFIRVPRFSPLRPLKRRSTRFV
jgi:hypothetical protein